MVTFPPLETGIAFNVIGNVTVCSMYGLNTVDVSPIKTCGFHVSSKLVPAKILINKLNGC